MVLPPNNYCLINTLQFVQINSSSSWEEKKQEMGREEKSKRCPRIEEEGWAWWLKAAKRIQKNESKRMNEEFDQLVGKRIARRFPGPTTNVFPSLGGI